MKPALIIGSTCVDVILNIHHLPKTEENLRPTAQFMSLGGCAYNVSHIVRLLKAPHTFISPVGGGVYGDYVAKQLRAEGIPLTVTLPDRENGCCYCLVEATGERTFMSYHGVEYTFQKEWMAPYPAAGYGLAYVCGLEIEEPTGENLIQYLEENPCLQVFYAPGPRVTRIGREKNERILALHPILHINEAEAMAWSGKATYQEAAAHLHAITGNTVVVTLGEAGAYCIDPDGNAFLSPSRPVAHVADTIGAGDSHAGALIACLTMDMPLEQAVAYANRVAAAVVGVRGARLPARLLPEL